jgi:hypothetical protein
MQKPPRSVTLPVALGTLSHLWVEWNEHGRAKERFGQFYINRCDDWIGQGALATATWSELFHETSAVQAYDMIYAKLREVYG